MFTKRKKQLENTTEDSKFGLKTQYLDNGKKFVKLNKLKVAPLFSAAIITLFSGISLSYYYSFSLEENRQKISYIANLKQMSEKIDKSALQSKLGNSHSFEEIRDAENKMNNIFSILRYGGKESIKDVYINPINGSLLAPFNIYLNQWENTKNLLNILIEQESKVIKLKNNVNLEKKKLKNLMDLTVKIKRLSQNNIKNISTHDNIQELILLSNRINQGLGDLFSSESFSLENGYLLVKDIRNFEDIINKLEKGAPNNIEKLSGEELNELINLKQAYVSLGNLSKEIVKEIFTLNTIKGVSNQLSNSSQNLILTAENLESQILENINKLNIYFYLAIASFFFLIGIIALIVAIFVERSNRASRAAKILQKNQNNQVAINLLLDQIQPLSVGNFTTRVYVADKFVTQIAEQVDDVRVIMANMVKKIKEVSSLIVETANNTDETSKVLLEISADQFEDMENSIIKFNNIVSEIDDIAQTAWIAKKDSIESQEASKEGEDLVKKSIEKMTQIRTNIQESAKKIKKSSESAQAITEVIELIQNITKQIEVLSLNAAIQAAASGEGGKEFSVVAQEVKRLADDSKEATKQILHLVNDVKEDINIAVSSMEITTQQVVEGTKLTSHAGDALKKIEEISQRVGESISKASKKMEEKSLEIANISLAMSDLQSTTEKSKEIVKITAAQVESLKNISKDLNDTVKDYRVEK